MNNIKNVSLFFRTIFQMSFIALPILFIFCWIYAPEPLIILKNFIEINVIPETYSGMHTYIEGETPKKAILHVLSWQEKSLGALVSSIPLFLKLFIIYSLIKLFRLYGMGEIFSTENVKCIRNIAYALLLGQIIEPFYQFIMGFVLTLNNPIHHRYAAITLDQTNVGILLTALLIILISWIMTEGCKLREEQQLTI